jgi:MoxR-like ATPase
MLGNASPEETLARGDVKPVIDGEELKLLRAIAEKIVVRDEMVQYIVEIVRKTRSEDSVLLGGSPRATQALLLSGRMFAAISGRDYMTPDDVKTMALPVLEHRLILRPEYEIEGLTVAEVVERILQKVAVPR